MTDYELLVVQIGGGLIFFLGILSGLIVGRIFFDRLRA